MKSWIPALFLTVSAMAADPPPGVAQLASEVRTLGWIVSPARSDKGDWDLFLMRPDGSERRNITVRSGVLCIALGRTCRSTGPKTAGVSVLLLMLSPGPF